MFQYCLKRILLFFPTLFGIIFITFMIIQIVPGGPVEQMIMARIGGSEGEVSQQSGSDAGHKLFRRGMDEEQILQIKKLYGFDKPVHQRLLDWYYRLFTFQFGESYFHHRNVTELLAEKLPVSASLGIISFLLTYLICIPLGIARAVRSGSSFDMISGAIVLIGYSIPGFVLGVFLIILFAGGSFWDIFPLRGLVSDHFSELSTIGKIKDYLHHLLLPIICTTIGSFAVMTNLTRNSVLEQISQQYAMTAKSKGLTESQVIWKHVLRNAMIPLVTGFAGGFLTMFFGSSLLIETLFSLDGLGLLSYEAVIRRDYPVVMANLFFFSLLFITGNLLSDILYVLIDPRISFDKQAGN
ncbi:MAG: ABC transporter permease subunit [Deltaproteobacteria bacterium]|nr:ABC transporter permease subunit [Deltaproteobacteria bacterium]